MGGWERKRRREGGRKVYIKLGRGAVGVAGFLKLDIKNIPFTYLTSGKYCKLFITLSSIKKNNKIVILWLLYYKYGDVCNNKPL